jgi:hypothetical protein
MREKRRLFLTFLTWPQAGSFRSEAEIALRSGKTCRVHTNVADHPISLPSHPAHNSISGSSGQEEAGIKTFATPPRHTRIVVFFRSRPTT